jgi:hypothetical protein
MRSPNKTPKSEYKGICAQEGCKRKVIGGPRHRYCFEHKGMSPPERRVEAQRLKALKASGKKDKYQEW